MRDPEKVLFNFSSHQLTEHEKSLLSRGLNFAIPPKSLNYADYLLPFVLLFRDIALLAPLTSNEYTIKDSFSFAEELLSFDSNLVMASFDVESLFTNIPLKGTIDLCVDIIFYDRTNIDGITKDYFHDLLTICMSESLALFDGEYYKQIDGVAMGSPLGPTFANIFLCFYEQIWLENCPVEFKPVVYRYVDDTFLLFRSHENIEKFRAYQISSILSTP